jgi:xanthine dehydrogenase YagR molybdenum-binding subunit
MEYAWPKDRKVLSTESPRVDAPIKVDGRAKYAYDIQFPNLLYGRILRSPYAAANLRKINVEKARALPGVKAIAMIAQEGARVRYAGEEILALAAVSKQIADDALKLIEIDYEPLPHVVNVQSARREGAPRVFDRTENIGGSQPKTKGNIDQAFAEAAAVVEGEFRTPVQLHACLETHGLTAKWDGDELTVWASTQGITSVREDLASHLKIPINKVRVICDVMGGGFGSKFGAGVEGGAAAKLAREAGAPVKMLLDRKAEFLAVGNRPNTVQKLKLGADKEGKLVAFRCEGYGTGGTGGGGSSAGGSGGVAWPAPYIYPVPNASTDIIRVLTNTGAARAFRAPQHPPASFGMESIMDLLAYKMGFDPLEFRKLNDPNPTRQKEYVIGAERFGWKEKYHLPGQGSPGPIKRGVGVASSTWGSGGSGSKAECQVHADGSVEVRCGTQDLGTGSRTVVAMIAAETFGLRPEQIVARIGDTNFPPSGGSGGSTTTPSIAPAIRVACVNALNALNERVGENGTWKERCARLGMDSIVEQGAWQPGLSGAGIGGVQFAEVEVDTETGQIRVVHVTCIQDAGLIINELTARNQAYGGLICGIGYALFEERIMDDQTGVMLNPNFETYKIPSIADIPTIDVHFLDQPERGAIGLGEAVHVPAASCIANAVHNAIGVRVCELPMTPNRVLAALEERMKDEG